MHRQLALILVSAWSTACSGAATNEANQANQAAAPAGPTWAVQQVTLDDGVMAWEFARQLSGGRVAYRIFGGIQRGVTVACPNFEASNNLRASPDAAERLLDARERITVDVENAHCEIGPGVLDGFDAGFAELERRAQADPLPADQNWLPVIAGFGIERLEHEIQLQVLVADSPGAFRGEASVTTFGSPCPIGDPHPEARFATGGGAAARATAAREALSRLAAEAARRCNLPTGTAERWMAGFDEALAAAEARLAAAD